MKTKKTYLVSHLFKKNIKKKALNLKHKEEFSNNTFFLYFLCFKKLFLKIVSKENINQTYA